MKNEETTQPEENFELGKPFKLPSGKECVIGEFLGEHVMEADELVGPGATQSKVIFAMASLVTTIDGQKFVFEDVAKMPGKDALKIKGVFVDLNF